MSATDVEEQKNLWPPTPMTLAGATELGLAALIAFAARRRRRPRVAPLPAVGGWLVPIALVALAIEGCSTAAGTGVIDAGQLDQQTGGVSFANDVYPIVSASCALTGCHDMGITTNHWTDYTTAEATYTRWVNGPGFDFCTDQPPYVQRVIVVPGDPDASYLMLKIAPPTDAPCQDPTHHRRMPPDPREPLTAASIETIRTWIAEGALQN
jgi:hypothetical protein